MRTFKIIIKQDIDRGYYVFDFLDNQNRAVISYVYLINDEDRLYYGEPTYHSKFRWIEGNMKRLDIYIYIYIYIEFHMTHTIKIMLG